MHWDPSIDADQHFEAQEEAAAAEIAWWDKNCRLVTIIAASLLQSPGLRPFEIPAKQLVDRAGEIVLEITKRGEPL